MKAPRGEADVTPAASRVITEPFNGAFSDDDDGRITQFELHNDPDQ